MDSLSMWHWLIILVILAIYLVPLWRIVSRAGFHGAFSVLALIPFVNIVMLWVFAFAKWPRERDGV
jgi:hypothetical protein